MNRPAQAASLWSVFIPLLPLSLAVFAAVLASGAALPVLPLHVHDVLGQGTAMVGLVMGSQFAGALAARLFAGHVADTRGVRIASFAGLFGIVGVGAVYFLSLAYSAQPQIALAIIFAARLLTGVSESFLITAILSWGIARVQPEHAGKVIGWVGVFLFAAYGVGAPMGVSLHQHFGFAGIAGAALLLPFAAGLCLLRVPGTTPSNAPRPPFYTVLGAVKLPGLGLTLCSVGYAMVTAFIALLFVQRGWGSAAIAFTSMGAGFILARLPFGHLPDKVGGARVAFTCVLLVGAGQLLVWLADAAWTACAGTALTGAGYALAFQGFGVEAVRRAPPQSRGAALGGYVAFQDIAMGLAAPVGGLLAHVAGLQSIYLFGAILAFGSALVAWRLRA